MTRTPTPLYREFANLIRAIAWCNESGNAEWHGKHNDDIKRLLYFMPSGSGVDSGTELDLDNSTPEKLVFHADYHHMNECGMYDGWTEHTITVRPSLQFGITLSISGRNRNDVKDYLHGLYDSAIRQQVWQTADSEWHSDDYEPIPTV